MIKFSITFLILILILFTALVKNSTKRIDDEILKTEKNIKILKKNFENIKLEHDYLSSAEKLIEYHNLYFDDVLFKKRIQEIKIIDQTTKKLKIKKLTLINE